MSSEITSPTTRGYPSSTYNAYSPTLSSPSVSSPNKRQHPSPPEDAPPIEGKLKRVRRKLDFDDPELFNPWKAVSEPGLNKIFPEDFLQDLDRQNLSQKDCAPIALILRAENDDERSTLSNPHINFFIFQVSKVYRTAIKIVRQTSDLSGKMREAFKTFGLRANLLLLIGHGSGREILLGNPESGLIDANLDKNNISTIDFKWLSSDAHLILFACKAGLKIAQPLADASQRSVSAFKNSIEVARAAFIQEDHESHFVYFNCNKKEIGSSEIISKFYPQKPKKVVLFQEIAGKETMRKILSFFSDKKRYLKNLAKSKGPEKSIAQYALVEECLNADTASRPMQELQKKAFKWLTLSAENGYPLAQHRLGICYCDAGDQQSKIRALEWFEKAAKNGCTAGEYDAARMYLEEANPSLKALAYLQSAAKKGHAGAQFYLAGIYRNGLLGKKVSDEKAFYWLQKSAENGYEKAQYAMANICFFGHFEKAVSHENAFYWLKKAAANKHPQAQYDMATIYESGQLGKKVSDEKAFYWVQKAAKNGHAEAQYVLGEVYRKGLLNVLPSISNAMPWYEKAAEKGHGKAKDCLTALSLCMCAVEP